jgi:ferredoxin-NADP reductase
MAKIYETSLVGQKQVAKDTVEITISRPEDFKFETGQYIQLGVPDLKYSDPKGKSRVLSIASSPDNDKEISLAFRKSDSGFKRTLMEMEDGAKVLMEGPHGFHTLPKDPERPLIFVAGGIGITPFLSMIRYAIKNGANTSITLLYGNQNRDRAAYLEELQNRENRNKCFNLEATYERINKNFLTECADDPKKSLWYIAGPPGMVPSIRNSLFQLGVHDDNIFYEEFTGY